MNHARFLTAALAASLVFSTAAFAQHRGGHESGGASYDRGGGNRGGDRGWGHGGRGWNGAGRYEPRGYYRGWAGPRYYSPYSYPSAFYLAPYFSVPLYAPEPPIVYERYYIEEAPPAPPPVHRMYSERSYAQVEPRAPAQPPAPRMERVTLSAKELFGFDEAKLRLPQPRLDQIAAELIRNPQIGGVTITGYTDRIGTESYNLRLSQRRAAAVKSYLVAKGVAANRLDTVGKGESNPVVQCSDKKMSDLIKCLEPNRRVEVEQITIERRVP